MAQTVSLYLRITKDGKRQHILANLKKQAGEGVYCLRYEVNGKRVWDSVRDNLKEALRQLKLRDYQLSVGRFDAPADETEPDAAAPQRLTLAQQREKFLTKKNQRNRRGEFLDSDFQGQIAVK